MRIRRQFLIRLRRVYNLYFLTYLSDGIFALNDGQDSLLLDGRRVFKTVAVDASKDSLLQSHIVKLINFQIPVRFKNLFHYLCCNDEISLNALTLNHSFLISAE